MKTRFCLSENKDADQLCSNCTDEQRICFRYKDSTIHLHGKCEISSFWHSSLNVQASLCKAWSETLKNSFLTSRLIYVLPTQELQPTCRMHDGKINTTIYNTTKTIS